MKKVMIFLFASVLILGNDLFGQSLGSDLYELDSKVSTESLIAIYPNPTTEYLNIAQTEFDGSISQLEIIDLSGHTIYSVNEEFTQLSIYVGNWRKGVYMVIFHQGTREVMHKVVVQ